MVGPQILVEDGDPARETGGVGRLLTRGVRGMNLREVNLEI